MYNGGHISASAAACSVSDTTEQTSKFGTGGGHILEVAECI